MYQSMGLGFLFILFLSPVVSLNCSSIANHLKGDKVSGRDSTEKVSCATSQVVASLVPALEVSSDSCMVFLQPGEQSFFFGPLAKTEQVHRLDRDHDWIYVWIPRLRVSGWLRSNQVCPATRTASHGESIPTEFLTTVTVITNLANVRASPETRARILTRARENQQFWLLDERDGWLQIWLPDMGKKGWIYGKLIRKSRAQ